MKLLDHPNIVKVYEIIENEDRIYLIMEYAAGGELFEYIVGKEKLEEKESAHLYS